MSEGPLVSIIIDNFNYDRFLSEAIDSALKQSYAKTEVIVVDDGSSDASREIIAGYGQQVILVLKKNGGQASAFNAGFARSRGEVVVFLDADDILMNDIVQRVVNVFQSNPDIARVQYRLKIIDAAGQQTGSIVPPEYLPLPNGNLRENILELVNCSSWSPTSGNAFAAWTLRRILPMPEAAFKLSADYYLSRANALFGSIAALDEVGAYYRVHGTNGYFGSTINLAKIRQEIELAGVTHQCLKPFVESINLKGYSTEATDIPDEIFLAQRMISFKLDAKTHPVPKDTPLWLFWQGTQAALYRPNLSIAVKIIHIFWFAAMLVAPGFFVYWLAQQFLPETRVSFNKILGVLQGRQKHASSISRRCNVQSKQTTAKQLGEYNG